jgi:hypothetical protein
LQNVQAAEEPPAFSVSNIKIWMTMIFKSCLSLHRRYQDSWPIRRVVMAALAAQWAVLSVKKHALADMRLHVAFGRPSEFACAVAKGTI